MALRMISAIVFKVIVLKDKSDLFVTDSIGFAAYALAVDVNLSSVLSFKPAYYVQ